jgi:alpha-tubulin suppressor-like RCC1 family protein
MRTSMQLWTVGIAGLLVACGDDSGSGASAGSANGGTGGSGADGGAGAGMVQGAGGSGGSGGGPDTAAPTTSFLRTPAPGQTNGVPSEFELGCDEASCSFECSFEGGAFAACDATFAFDPLEPGTYSIAVRATDTAGNVEAVPKVHQWTLGFGYRTVVANYDAACAISGSGVLYCWGDDSNGLLADGTVDVGPTATPVQAGDQSDWDDLFVGAESFCATRSGSLYCWGYPYALGDEQAESGLVEPVLFSDTLVSLYASYGFACGLDAAGALYCVGNGDGGVLGDGDASFHYVTTPAAVGSDSYSQVAVGDGYSCAIRADGRLLCWGRQPVTETVFSTPTLGDDVGPWGRVAVGEQHACAVKTNGELYCWGENYAGQLGLGTFEGQIEPTRVGSDTDWVEVSASESSSCAIKVDGTAFCWGENYSGQLGSVVAPIAEVNQPQLVSTEVGLRTISGWGNTFCAQSALGEALCWGANEYGQLGRGVLADQGAMKLIDDQFDKLATNYFGGCGLASGSLLCWGTTAPNGDSDYLPRPTPTLMTADTDWTQVTISPQYSGHACGIRAGAIYCWGTNDFGQLGTGDTVPSPEPTPVISVPGVTAWSHVSAGLYATCGVATNGNLYCWGFNQYGQLGIGNTEPQLVPTQVAGSGWATVEMGDYRVGARKLDGSFHYWGVNAGVSPTQVAGFDWAVVDNAGFGECGIKMNGTLHCTLQGIATPFQAGSAADWVGIVGPSSPYCALNSQGAVGCFVANGLNTGLVASPAIDPSSGWLQLENGGGHACGLRNGTERHCRGYRNLGSLGDGFDERVPTAVLTP